MWSSDKIFVWGFVGVNAIVWINWHTASMELVMHQRAQLPDRKRLPPPMPADVCACPKWRYMEEHFVLSPENLRAGRWWTTLTSAISNRQAGHLACNMLSFSAGAWFAFKAPKTNGMKFQLFLIWRCIGSLTNLNFFLNKPFTDSPL
jgi:membrane associated rhomboid family serine protease